MRNTGELLRYILEGVKEVKLEDNKISIGEKDERINIMFSCSPNPLDHVEMFRSIVKERKPIVWVKDHFTDQLFRNHDLKEFVPNFHHTITILSPDPEGEIRNIVKYDLPKELFVVKLFNSSKIIKCLFSGDNTSTKEDKKIVEKSINNILESILYQETFSFSNFLLG